MKKNWQNDISAYTTTLEIHNAFATASQAIACIGMWRGCEDN